MGIPPRKSTETGTGIGVRTGANAEHSEWVRGMLEWMAEMRCLCGDGDDLSAGWDWEAAKKGWEEYPSLVCGTTAEVDRVLLRKVCPPFTGLVTSGFTYISGG
jgi:hypothetical protein